MSVKKFHIVTAREYKLAINSIEKLMKKGEQNLTKKEVELLNKSAGEVEAYEEHNKMTPVPRNKKLAGEKDSTKISSILGYEPDLIGLVEFKMFQLKINQNGLAEMLKMPASKISQILNKKRDPDIPFLKGIHEKLGVDGNYILETV
jgi:HTH-type transcriptional regulator / antitoxin HigA